ncbi:MAG TPA: SprB repeat-containing protein, partial [Bacteroidia bacterium]|nr:SprB repeat-containing protein [Bacteroidia bacterium]
MKKVTSKAIGALSGILLCATSISFGSANAESGKTKNNNGVAVCPTITVKTVTSNNGCYGLNNGVEIVSATGGSIPYTFSWSTGATSTSNTNDTLKNLPPGSYTVNVTDVNSCPGTLTVTLTQPTQLRDSISNYVMVKCNGGKTGNATVGVKGGTTAYTYKWTPGGGTFATLSGSTFLNNQAAGSYEVVVTDKNGCKDSANAVITQPAAIKDSILVTNVLCNGGKTGGATVVSTTGGTSPFTYTWATVPPTTGTTVTGLAAGSYTLSTKDGNNCTVTNTVTITQPAVLTVSATSTV